MTRVLIVDDKDDNLYYLRVLLQAHGCEVVEARHGAEALVLARQSPPEVVVSDLLMPIMDGYTLLRHWKADDQLRSIPFVVYTATYTEAEDERLAYDLGADGFILKPAEPDVFVSKVRALVNRATEAVAPPRVPDANEADVLKVYSETLIRKLEEKTLQLEESNRALQRDLAERLRAEAERQLLLHALGERVKELRALRAAATLLQDTRAPIETLLAQLAALLPPAFQFPDIAAARVTMGPATSATPSFRATAWTLAARFETSDGTDGSVEVAYLEERPASHSGPFLAEEVDLLQSLADMLRSHVERRRAEDARRASEAMLRTASRMARLGAWTIERAARHVVWSSELREILEGGGGAVPTLAEGLALYAPEYRDAVTAAVRAALAEGTPFDLEVAIDTLRGAGSGCACRARPSATRRGRSSGCAARCRTSRIARTWSSSSCARNASRASARWRAASRTT